MGIFLCLIAAPSAHANVVGSDAQNFNPTTSGLDFVTVHSSETLQPGVFNLGLFSNYAKNSFPFYETAGAEAQRSEKENALLGGDLNLGFGLGKNWDAGISFPLILSQEVSNSANVGRYSSTGNTEIRINTKFRLFGNPSGGMALIASSNFNRIAQNPYVGTGGGPSYNLELAVDTTISQVALALNLGYRWRNPGEPIPDSGIEPIPNQRIGSAALSYLINDIDTKVIFEILTAVPEKAKLQNATDREYSVTEAQLGIKHDTNSNLSLHLGAGAGLVKGVSSPDYRVYAGLNYSFGSAVGKKSVQVDPYAEDQKQNRLRRRKALRAQTPPPEESEDSAPPGKRREERETREESETQTAAGRRHEEAEEPAPASKRREEIEESKTQEAIEETKPSISVDTVREVKVFNRGTYNHIVLNSIEFTSGSNNLTAESERYLSKELAPALRELHRRRPIKSIIVEGHTDSIGEEQVNLALSLERARQVERLMRKSLGLDIPIRAVGLGEASPIADNGNYQGRALNRRVEFKLLYQRSAR